MITWIDKSFACSGQWREAQIVRGVMDQLWAEYVARQPSLPANWDRSTTRPLPKPEAPKKAPAKKKPAKAPPPPGKPSKDPDLPEVKFETPPPTPPATATIVPTKKVERDEEFWNMYNKD